MRTFATAEKGSKAGRKSGQPASGGRDPAGRQRNAGQDRQVRSLLDAAPIQAKLKVGKANDALEREADSTAERVVSMSQAPSTGVRPTAVPHSSVLQTKCPLCEDELRRQTSEEDEEELVQTKNRPGGSSRLTADQALGIGLSGNGGRPLSAGERAFYEPRFGHDFSQVRIHDGSSAARAAEGIGARAFTHGSDIVFGRGERNPHSRSGRLLLAHELSHVIQQGQAAPLRTAAAARASVADAVTSPAGVSGVGGSLQRACACGGSGGSCSCGSKEEPELQLKRAGDSETIQRDVLDDFLDDPLGTALGVAEDAGEAAFDFVTETVPGIASSIWNTAVAIAEAVGGRVSLDGTTIVIDIDEFDPCPELSFDLSLSDLGLDPTLYFPIVAGALGIGIVDVVGVLGAEVHLDPGFGFNLADCNFGPAQIRINPLSLSTSVAGQLSITGASMVQLGGDLGATADLFGVIAWPDPPIVLVVPVVGLALGGTYQFMLQAGGTITGRVSASTGLGGFSAANLITGDIGVGLDLAYGLYGALRVLGADLCRVGWPLGSMHWDEAASFSLASSISVGTGGLSFSLGVSAAPMASNPLDDLGFAFDASRLEDECWLCDFLTSHGLMPSQNGYNWANSGYQSSLTRFGGPRPDIMARDPGITSGSLCRGTCGINCPKDTCDKPKDLKLCETRGNRHVWHTYANYATCGAHQGCRDHDACYDMAADMPIWGFGGYMIGPMYRACDLDAVCGHGFQQAVIWAGGGGPYDGRLAYADSHKVTPGCLGPCPEEVDQGGEGEDGGTLWETCLDPYPLFDRREVPLGPYRWSTGNLTLWEQPVWDLPPVTAELYARGEADAGLNLGLGPAYLTDMCLSYDPATGGYSGTAALVLDAFGEGVIGVTGFLGGGLDLLSFDFLRAACAEGYLRGEARPRLDISGRLHSRLQGNGFRNGRVPVNCDGGNLNMQTGLTISPELSLTFELSAGVRVELGFFEPLKVEVWNGGPWTLHEQRWSTGWEIDIDLPALAAGVMPAAAVTAHAVDLNELVGWLMDQVNEQVVEGDAPEEDSLPGCGGSPPNVEPPTPRTCATVIEDPLTVGRARNVDSIKDDIDDHSWSSETFTLPTGGTETVGIEMESPYLTSDSTGGSNDTASAQTDIYGFGKLPQDGAFGSNRRGITRMSYVKGHLLRGEFGGPVTGENLYPITRRANNPDHFQQVERPVERLLGSGDAGSLVYYKVRVVDRDGPHLVDVFGDGSCTYYYVNADYDCTWATYKLCSDGEGNDLVERNPSQNRQIHSAFDLNAFIQRVRQQGCPQRP